MSRYAISDVPGLDGPVREQVYAHVFGSADRQVGGILVGRVSSQSPVPLVTAVIAATHADEQLAEMTFTQDSWGYVHRVLVRDFPDDEIVGWYHSHPGFGVVLSEHDRFIHRNFFSGASQIVLVVDPVRGLEGVFGWHDDEVAQWYERPTSRLAIGAAAPVPLDPRMIVPSPGVGPPPGHRVFREDDPPALPPPLLSPWLAWLLGAVLAGALLGLVLWELALRTAPAGS